MINIAIIEDDAAFREKIRQSLQRSMTAQHTDYGSLPEDTRVQIQCFCEASEVLLTDAPFDLYCIDIMMPRMDGFTLANAIRKRYGSTPELVFITSNEAAVYSAFQYQALAYVRKSSFENDFDTMIRSFQKKWHRTHTRLTFHYDNCLIVKTAEQIIYAEARGHTLQLYCTDDIIRISETLNELSKRLACEGFVQTCRSHLVNCKYIQSISAKTLLLTTKTIIPVSRNRRAAVKDAFMNYMRK